MDGKEIIIIPYTPLLAEGYKNLSWTGVNLINPFVHFHPGYNTIAKE
jgi:hypothetical protein